MEKAEVFYEGRVQGVGFRYTAQQVAKGFEVSGTVRNLPDSRVQLIAQGERGEVEAFLEAIGESGLGGNIRGRDVSWHPADPDLLGFRIEA
ncbi:MAG: acylphosphatase [Verrucomicrobiota bacterium]